MTRPMTRTEHTLALAYALKCENLPHAVYNILTCAAWAERQRGFATVPQIAITIGVTFQAVDQQIRWKGKDFFLTCDDEGRPRRYNLSPDAIELLAKVHARVSQYAAYHFPEAQLEQVA